MILEWIEEACCAGARLEPSCKILGLNSRTIKRWRERGGGADGRHGPKREPANKLSPKERAQVLEVANSPRFRDKSPKQIVPTLADEGEYIASESSMYRVLREEGQQNHRGRAKAPSSPTPREHRATGPNQVWSWDITYLKAPIRGEFFYLYLILDIWSRKIVGAVVHEQEDGELAAQLFRQTTKAEDIDPDADDMLFVHSDNGGPMKGATLKATFDLLGVTPTYSRPSVSNDNPYSESIFRTVKHRPEFPKKPFESLEAAIQWVEVFIKWYNTEHLHSSISFTTPADRHSGAGDEILLKRQRVYENARKRNPNRWSKGTRNWVAPNIVFLNPSKETKEEVRQLNAA